MLNLNKYTYKHTYTFNGPFSGTTRVSRYEKGKTNLDFTEAKRRWVAVASAGPYASLAPCSRQITTPAPHHSVFYRPDALPATQPTAPRSRQITTPAPYHSVFYRPHALPAAQPTASKHWRQKHRGHTKELAEWNISTNYRARWRCRSWLTTAERGWSCCDVPVSLTQRDERTTDLPTSPEEKRGALKTQVLENASTEKASTKQRISQGWKTQVRKMQVGLQCKPSVR